MKQLLKALAAKTGLDVEEIVGAYAKRGTKVSNELLEVQHDPIRAFKVQHKI